MKPSLVHRTTQRAQKGMVLVGAIFLVVAFLALFVTLGSSSFESLRVSDAKIRASNAFYAAEAGLNRRFDDIQSTFGSFQIPSGTPPLASLYPCGEDATTVNGTGGYKCQVTELATHRAASYVTPLTASPETIRVPTGERFDGLMAYEYRYEMSSMAFNKSTKSFEAKLSSLVRNRAVPLFQFAAFYGKDLEYYNGPPMVVNGPVHTNGDLYLDTDTSLGFLGRITASGNIYRGLKHKSDCLAGSVRAISDYGASVPFKPCASRIQVSKEDVELYAGSVRTGVPPPELPPVSIVKAEKGGLYWDKANLRIAVEVDNKGQPIDPLMPVKVLREDRTIDTEKSEYLHECVGQIKRKVPKAYEACDWSCMDKGPSPYTPPPQGGPSTGAWNRDDIDLDKLTAFAAHRWGTFMSSPVSYSGNESYPSVRPSEKKRFQSNVYGKVDPDTFPNFFLNPGPINDAMCKARNGIHRNPLWPTGVVDYQGPFETSRFGGTSNCCADWCESWNPATPAIDGRSLCDFRSSQDGFSILEVDMQGVLSCIQQSIDDGTPLLENGVQLGDTTKNGLVFFATVIGPFSGDVHNLYSVLLGHAQTIQALPSVRKDKVIGLTVASDQAIILAGNYNTPVDSSESVAASLVADTIHVFSEAVCDDFGGDQGRISFGKTKCNEPPTPGYGTRWVNYTRVYPWYAHEYENKIAYDTSVRAALLVGSDTSGGVEGPAGQDKMVPDSYVQGGLPWMSGGLMNVVHFHENWAGKKFEYTGSVVSLWKPQHYSAPFLMPGRYICNGTKMESVYEAPDRIWRWDESFGTPAGLPPLTPLLNYTQQEVFEDRRPK
jgi:hypothetical protein